MDTLKELIEGGEYELAAYRLVYGVFRAQMQESAPRTCSQLLPCAVDRRAKESEKESVSHGQA